MLQTERTQIPEQYDKYTTINERIALYAFVIAGCVETNVLPQTDFVCVFACLSFFVFSFQETAIYIYKINVLSLKIRHACRSNTSL